MSISHVLLFLTYRCNLRCKFCLSFNRYWSVESMIPLPVAAEPRSYVRPGLINREMSTADIVERVIPQCEKNGVNVIALSGGEVLMRRDASEIFRALGASSMRWCLDSNLMLCDETFAETVIDSSCDTVFVSLDGAQDTHNKLRNCSKAYQKTIANIQLLAEARKRADTRHTAITINFVLQPGNETELADMVMLAVEFGADNLCFQLQSGRNYMDPFDAKAAVLSLETALMLAEDQNLKISTYPLSQLDADDLDAWFSMPLTDRFYGGCTYIHNNLRIDPCGDVIPCMEFRLGNILEQNLSEIWTGQSYNIFRQLHAQDGPFEACMRCCNMTAKTGGK